ncbi:hypothetical protein VTK73DRAFT_9527 [Phialemonium thermophilum]|uniref:Uncharacterized protein n=1 Tax=Phialemonium thermophilum TaxID=223376 RepID=A0ABR3XK47_9PEZI
MSVSQTIPLDKVGVVEWIFHDTQHGMSSRLWSARKANPLVQTDAVVEAFNPAASVYQGVIVRAEIVAGVSHLITPDFSSNTFNENIAELSILSQSYGRKMVLRPW